MQKTTITVLVALGSFATLLVVAVQGIRSAGAAASSVRPPETLLPSATTAPVLTAPVVNPPRAARGAERDFVGVFVAREAAELAPLVSGRLTSVRYRIGDRVRVGEILATLDARAHELDIAAARSQFDVARAELAVTSSQSATAREQEARARLLGAEGLASGAELTVADGERRVAELRADSAKATLKRQGVAVARLERERDETQVRAPFDGIVVARYIDPGVNVTPSRPILRVVRTGGTIVRFALPEERANTVRIGTEVRAVAPALGVEVRASVRRISPEVDVATRWFVVEADAHGDYAETLIGGAADVFLVEAPR